MEQTDVKGETEEKYDVGETTLASKRPEETKAPVEESEPPVTRRVYQTGIIERGHIYFFYRPKVQHEETQSLGDVRNFHMLLVPRPPAFASALGGTDKKDNEPNAEEEMKVLSRGADVVPAPETLDNPKKRYRLITIGRKHLPEPADKRPFWATVTSVGDDLSEMEKGLGPQAYETMTRGARYEEAARLVARGAYAIFNYDPHVPSKRATYFAYHTSHPEELGQVQADLGIEKASVFVMQVKNPLAPPTGPLQARAKGADYPEHLINDVFRQGSRGRESYGLRFTSCETPELLDYKGAQLIFISARVGTEAIESRLGEGRGEALEEVEHEESKESIEEVYRELSMDAKEFPAEALKGEWV